MAPPNLTRIDAERRAALLDVAEYVVEVDLTDGSGAPGEATFATRTTVRFACREPGAGSWIDFVGDGVESARLNGAALDVSGYREDDGIALPDLAADNELTVVATGRYMNTGEGLHRFVDPVDDAVYLYSQFETADAKRLFACFDQPDLKARYRLTVTAPADWKVVSNATAQVDAGGPGGAAVHRFAPTEILSTYLVALVAGPYAEWRDEHVDATGVIPLGLYCRASVAEHMDADRLFHETKQGFDFYHAQLRHPVPVRQVRPALRPRVQRGRDGERGRGDVPRGLRLPQPRHALDSTSGATRPCCTRWPTCGSATSSPWHGGTTCGSTSRSRRSPACCARPRRPSTREAWTTFANVEKSWAYRQDQLPSTHPVAADIPDLQAVEVNFDGITYAKGASVLKQLVAYVGLDPFLAGLRAYFEAHKWGNATFDDLLGALEEASGRDLSGWGAQWLKTTGLNLLRPSFEAGRGRPVHPVRGRAGRRPAGCG